MIAVSYIGIGVILYDAAASTDMSRNEQLKYSIVWPWLIIATLGCMIWDFFSPSD